MLSVYLIFINELKKQFCIEKKYLLNFLSDILMYYILFMGMYFFIKLNADNLSQSQLYQTVNMQIIGYISWFFFSFTINFMSNGISNECTQGTFEQLCINPNNILKIFVIKLIVLSIRNIILILPLIILLSLSTGISVSINYMTIIIFFIMIFGILGFSLLLGGLEIYYKKVGQFPFIISIIFLGTSMINISKMPRFLKTLSYYLPFTKGSDLMKYSILKGYHIGNNDIILLTINSAIYLFIGLFSFYFYFNKSKQNGTLSRF